MISTATSIYNFMRDFHKKDGDMVAVIRGNKKMTFNKFFKEIDRVAGGLQKLGVKKGDTVVIALPNILQAVVAVYAVSKIGAVCGMIHPLLAPDEFERALKIQNPKVVFLSDINSKKIGPKCIGQKVIFCPYLMYSYIGLPFATKCTEYVVDGSEDIFYMQSGGTSGAPKTVAIPSKSANEMAGNLLEYLDDKFSNRNKMLTFMPMFHGFGLVVGVHAPLCTNMSVVLLPKYSNKKVCELIKKYKITQMLAVPHVVNKLLSFDGFNEDVLNPLEDIFVGGDTVTDELVKKFESKVSKTKSKAKLSPGYGLTETVSVCTLTKGDVISKSVGNPINGVKATVVDENDNVLGIDKEGELVLNSNQFMSRYVGDNEGTEKSFITIDNEKYLKTGDLFKIDDKGRLYFLGRKKRLIKISGVNVFPVEIERVASSLPFIKECLAIEYKEQNKTYIKLLVEGSLTDAQKNETIAYITKELSHWNTPKVVECIKEFPRTKVGKIDIVKVENEYK